MAFSKVTLNGDTLMDVTQKTVTAASMLSGVTALKNDGTGITGTIASKSSSDLTVSGATVTAPAGHYASSASKSVATGTATTPATTITANPSMSVAVSSGKNLFDMDCLLEADGWVEDNGDYYGQIRRVLEEYPVGTGVPIYGSLKENTQYTVSLTVRIDSEEGTNNGLTVVAYYSDGTHANVCGALRNQTTWTRISGTTTSGKTVTSILISYSNGGANVWHIKEAQIEEGATLTDYTPYAMQAAVNATVSASQSVTPTVSAGYVSTGTAGTVSVGGSGSETVLLSDLVSGTKSITASGTTDVTNYASASVAAGSATTPATSITANPTVSIDIAPGKNLLPHENGDVVSASGLTFTVRSDGGIHINGTNGSTAGYSCYTNTSSALNLAAGSYRFLLTGSGTGSNGASLQLYGDTGSGMSAQTSGTDFTYTISSSTVADYVRIRCSAGTYDCDVYPMIIYSNETDTTFEPYALQATVTATINTSQSVTPTVSAGYVSSGTAGTVSVSGSATEQLTTQAATTYHPSTTDQTIASGKYLTGAQTIKAVVTTNLTAANIADGVTVKIGDSTDDDCVASITGTHSGGGGGLEYEEGTWTPTEDIARATISFQRTHSEMPIHVILSDISSKDTLIENSCTFWCYDDPYLISGYPFPLNASSAVQCYSISQWVYSSSSSYGAGRIYCTYPSSNTSDSSSSFPRYWVTETGFHPYSNSASRYFRSGRSYKWIAVWAPTT